MLRGLALTFALSLAPPAMAAWHHEDVHWGKLHCPSDNTSTLPTPTYGSEGSVWMICTEMIIDAPPRAIYDALLDFRSYHLWNSFVVDVELPENVTRTPDDVYVGMPMFFTVAGLLPDANTTSDEILTVLDDQSSEKYLMNAWRSNTFLNGTLSQAEHPNILTSAEFGRTRYVSYETYYDGPNNPLLFPLKGQLQAEFDQQGLDLKRYVEAL
ncbi:uncharacterized protein JN550_002828 [Neoarthrinium moseri]|uniref:uncharacterized protein n=1 Tax=Neoarthrinium moseri TaxID=1658444 RepID=UPI001FDE9D5D|nr:uncharacterized protein JN550_002828 [Neoarthrinium moseri]KAI1874249.1 hypothetical protein JN550_002828 [Neoarthrinium moseri]